MIETMNAVVLSAEDQGDFDQRITIYTKEIGKIKAKVVGVKKSTSKLRAVTIPFVESRLQVYLHGTKRAGLRDPGKIVGGETIDTHVILRSDWDRMIQTAACCEILDSLTHPGYPNPQQYDLLASSLRLMETSASPVLVRLRFTLILLKILGYSMRHHPVWMSFPARQKSLLMDLARWDVREKLFSDEDTGELGKIVHSYLSNYLPSPLKTRIFEQKLESAATA